MGRTGAHKRGAALVTLINISNADLWTISLEPWTKAVDFCLAVSPSVDIVSKHRRIVIHKNYHIYLMHRISGR